MNANEIQLLTSLLSIASPSGDEWAMTDWLIDWLVNVPQAQVTRLRDCLIVTKCKPRVAIYAHIDTCGFTVGYGEPNVLIPIGSPEFNDGSALKLVNRQVRGTGILRKAESRKSWAVTDLDCAPGDRVIYSAAPVFKNNSVTSPYLDNRGGIWAALYALQTCPNICICFTTGEETGGSGAIICSRYIYDRFQITKALISDITWDTEHVHCGRGVAISRRDHWVPSQAYVDQIVNLADASTIKYQIEIESDGGSDGGGIERSGCPIDWMFVGAPSKKPHSSQEVVDLDDLQAMGQMLSYLVDSLIL